MRADCSGIDLSDKASIESPAPSLAPVDWGIAFALSHKRLLLSLAVLPIAVKLFAEYLRYSLALPQQQVFLLMVIVAAANAWLIAMVMMACIERAHGAKLRAGSITRSALRNLPKVLLSYVLLFSLLAGSLLLLPVLLLVLFFIWAPFYCVGEFYSTPSRKKEPDEYDLYEDEKDEPQRLEQKHFTDKSIWELGFSRSLQFTGGNLGVTFQIILLIWFANIIPMAAVDLVSPPHGGFLPLMLKNILCSFSSALVLGAAAAAFLVLQPPEAREEVGAARYLRLAAMGVHGRTFRLQGRFVLLGLLIAASVLGSLVAADRLRQSISAPESLLVEVQSARRENTAMRVTIRMNDRVDRFRWLDPQAVYLTFGDRSSFAFEADAPEVGSITEQQNAAKTQAESKKAGGHVAPLKPSRYVVIGEDGRELPPRNFSPYYRPLKLVLFYDLPEQLPKEGTFSLQYINLLGERTKLVQGSYGLDW